MAVKVMAVHAELVSVVLGPKLHLLRGIVPGTVMMDATRLLRLWNHEAQQSAEVTPLPTLTWAHMAQLRWAHMARPDYILQLVSLQTADTSRPTRSFSPPRLDCIPPAVPIPGPVV